MSRRLAALVLMAMAVPAFADEAKPELIKIEPVQLTLADGNLPLWELRPMDRRVYVVSLDGTWKKEARPGSTYFLNVRFNDGTVYSHRPINDSAFYQGEMRFMVPDYLLIRTNTAKGGKVAFSVTERPAAGARIERVSSSLELDWPLKRRILNQPPSTKATPPKPVDSFPPVEKDK